MVFHIMQTSQNSAYEKQKNKKHTWNQTEYL